MKKALIGFGGCGENLLETLAVNDTDFFLTALVRNEGCGNREVGKDKIVDLYLPSELELLARKLEGVDACFMVGGLGGGACQYMLELGRELRRKGIWTAALTILLIAYIKGSSDLFPIRRSGRKSRTKSGRTGKNPGCDSCL